MWDAVDVAQHVHVVVAWSQGHVVLREKCIVGGRSFGYAPHRCLVLVSCHCQALSTFVIHLAWYVCSLFSLGRTESESGG